MIRINLLPIRQQQNRATGQNQFMLFLVFVAAAVGLNYFWLNLAGRGVDELNSSITSMQEELRRYDTIIGEVKDIDKQKKALEQKLGVIDQLQRGKTGPVQMLDELARNIPQRVWLTDFRETDGTIKIEGRAVEHEDVSSFLKMLEQSKYFKNIVLGVSEETTDKEYDAKLYRFTITCTTDYSA